MELMHGLFISIYCGMKSIFDQRKILNENIYERRGRACIHTYIRII